MILRVRSDQGTWRITVTGPESTVAAVKGVIAAEKQVAVARQKLSSDPQGTAELDDGGTLASQGLSANGSMLYLTVADDEAAPPAAAAAPAAPAPRPPVAPSALSSAGERFLGGDGPGATDADDEAAIARAIAEAQAEFEAEGAPASPTVRAPDASTREALVGPAAGDFYGGDEDLPALIADLLGGVDAPAVDHAALAGVDDGGGSDDALSLIHI